jgi:hypothetical protein
MMPSPDGYNIEANQRTEITIKPSVSVTALVTKIGYAAIINPVSILNNRFKVETKVIRAGKTLAEDVKIIGDNQLGQGGAFA